MAITVFPATHHSRLKARLPERLVRLSRSPSPYAVPSGNDTATDPIGFYIAPVYQHEWRETARMPGPSFSAQLLELGLKHNVEGLIQKAHEQLSYQGAMPRSAQQTAAASYERAQDNFVHDNLHMVERNF